MGRQLKSSRDEETNLNALIRLLSDKYVDTLQTAHLYRDGIEGILTNLDPHTVYIPKEELHRVNEELEGSFYGIGVEFFSLHDTVYISGILKGGPCDGSLLRAGDRLLRIDDSLVAGRQLSDEDIIQRIRGKLQSRVRLTVLHPDGQMDTALITRGQIPIHSVAAACKLDERTGYMLLTVFSETTYTEFTEALNRLKAQGIKRLILDVRDNPGGYMEAVAQIADELISGEHVLISTIGKNRSERLRSEKKGMFEQGAVSVLVNEHSASASEILAGVIQDLDRGAVIGRRTYGKGLVQEQFELPDHSAIRITTARYYLPSGRCIQRPYTDGKAHYKDDLMLRYAHGELTGKDSSHPHTERSAFKTLHGRTVYGFEGITPDQFVPLDTLDYDRLRRFHEEHLAFRFAVRYAAAHPGILDGFQQGDDFARSFQLPVDGLKQWKEFLSTQAISPALQALYTTHPRALRSIHAELAKLRFGTPAFHATWAHYDEMVHKAMETEH